MSLRTTRPTNDYSCIERSHVPRNTHQTYMCGPWRQTEHQYPQHLPSVFPDAFSFDEGSAEIRSRVKLMQRSIRHSISTARRGTARPPHSTTHNDENKDTAHDGATDNGTRTAEPDPDSQRGRQEETQRGSISCTVAMTVTTIAATAKTTTTTATPLDLPASGSLSSLRNSQSGKVCLKYLFCMFGKSSIRTQAKTLKQHSKNSSLHPPCSRF